MRSVILALVLLPAICCAQLWQQMDDFPGTARDDAAAFAIDDKVYVGTGMDVGFQLTNDWYRFDGSTFQWSTIAPLPATSRQYCSAFTFLGPDYPYGYLFGGLDTNGPLNELWRYDPATDTWQQMASLPSTPRYAAVALNGGYITTGLFVDGTATNESWKYDPATDTWQQLASLPGVPRHRACGSSWGMVIGGADEDYNALADCWAYNSITDVWTACAALPEGRYGAVCGLASYDMVLLGGATDNATIVETGFRFNSTSWLSLGDPHPGGTRKGGVVIEGAGSGGSGTWNTYLGLGLSNDLTRHKDWYVTSGAFGIPENGVSPITVYPNPGTTSFTLHRPATIGKADLVVHDLSGRMILSTPLHSPTVDASAWPPGSYIVLLTSTNGDRSRAHWVKL